MLILSFDIFSTIMMSFLQRRQQSLKKNDVLLPNEVVAEIVYVLEKVYDVGNEEICETLLKLFKNGSVIAEDFEILEEALTLFGKKRLDFVDTLLYAYNKVRGYQVFTFDNKLNNLLK